MSNIDPQTFRVYHVRDTAADLLSWKVTSADGKNTYGDLVRIDGPLTGRSAMLALQTLGMSLLDTVLNGGVSLEEKPIEARGLPGA